MLNEVFLTLVSAVTDIFGPAVGWAFGNGLGFALLGLIAVPMHLLGLV